MDRTLHRFSILRDLRRRPKAGLGRCCSRLRHRAAEHRSRPGCSTAVPPPSTGRLQKPLSGFCARSRRYVPNVSPVRPAPCHACCMKQTPAIRLRVLKYHPCLFRRPAQKGHPRLASTFFVTYLWSQEQPRPSASRCCPLRGNAPPPPSPPPTSLSRPPLTLAACCEAATTSSLLNSFPGTSTCAAQRPASATSAAAAAAAATTTAEVSVGVGVARARADDGGGGGGGHGCVLCHRRRRPAVHANDGALRARHARTAGRWRRRRRLIEINHFFKIKLFKKKEATHAAAVGHAVIPGEVVSWFGLGKTRSARSALNVFIFVFSLSVLRGLF